jgi:hypothetical protein
MGKTLAHRFEVHAAGKGVLRQSRQGRQYDRQNEKDFFHAHDCSGNSVMKDFP